MDGILIYVQAMRCTVCTVELLDYVSATCVAPNHKNYLLKQ